VRHISLFILWRTYKNNRGGGMAQLADLDSKIQHLVERAKDLEVRLIGILRSGKSKGLTHNIALWVSDYEKWYSSAFLIIQRNLPEREDSFKDCYLKINNFVGPLHTILVTEGTLDKAEGHHFSNSFLSLSKQIGMLNSIFDTIEVRKLDIVDIVSAELMSDFIERAKHLLEKGYTREAGNITGVLLEKHLKRMCDKSIPVINYTEKDGLNNLATKLRQANRLSTQQLKEVQWMADIRNQCDHDKKKEPSKDDVLDFINHTSKFIKLVV
jgi:hypothetical protein